MYELDEMTGTVVGEVETVKSPSSSYSVGAEQRQQQQNVNIKSLNLQCDEEFNEALAERPSTSSGNYFPVFTSNAVQQHSNDNRISVESGGTVDDYAFIDSPLFNKMKRDWRVYGWYTSCEEMDEARRREKVSKRKSVTTVHGTKVFYRCNNWRRTKCNFRMYAIIFLPDKMCLFASGEHDHTAKDPYYITKDSPNVEVDSGMLVPTSTQQDILTQFVLSATADLPHDTEKEPEEVSQPELLMQLGMADKYHLADASRINDMLDLARDIDHTLIFTGRDKEFCFQPNDPALGGRSVVLLDIGASVLVIERYDQTELSREIWQKAYWNQFLWAVRGKCMRVSYQNFKEPGYL